MIRNFSSIPSGWNEAKAEIRNYLVAAARSSKPQIAYSELADKVVSMRLSAHSQELAALLGEISTEEDHAGRGMLSVLVVHKHNQIPGEGFFELARRLGRPVNDKIEFWASEFDRVCRYWRTIEE